jgi:heme peroxidase
MIRGHGQAERLLLEGVNLKAVDVAGLDDMMASGGEGIEAARRVHMNRFLGPGRFGRMFPDLKPFRPADADLIELAKSTLTDSIPPEEDPAGDNTIPAGFTYFGQFVDHDITFDPTLDFPVVNDPELQASARTPNLDLDSVYGLGPVLQPELYQDENQPGIPDPATARFRIGTTNVDDLDRQFEIPDPKPNDLPRVNDPAQPRAVIADGRNDENLIIAQLHLAFLKFHNLILASSPTPTQGETPFDAARRLVRWHYQWIVLNDFLPRVIDQAVLDDIRKNGRKFYNFKGKPFNGTPFMPVEFSVAAYRLGHSMIRDVYDFNRVFSRDTNSIGVRGRLDLLFLFTGTGRFAGVPTLPGRWIIDWRRFFEVDGSGLLNFARKLNTKLATILGMLTDVPASQSEALKMLPVRNLLRGSRVGLPTGQAVPRRSTPSR